MLDPAALDGSSFGWTSSWSWDPVAATMLVVALALYVRGVLRLRQTAGGARLIAWWQVGAYLAGWLALVAALVSPLDTLSDILFSAHMTQHELLMLVAAPLMALSRPLLVMTWAVDRAARERLLRWGRQQGVMRAWQTATGALTVWLLHAAALWVWHLPAFYQAALGNDAIHTLQHVTFFGTAALFWYSLVYGRYGRAGYGVAVLYVFTTAAHSGALGALLTFAPRVLYPVYTQPARLWGVDPLQDQELAGLIMWVPFSITFIVVGLALFAAWMAESDRRLGLGRSDSIEQRGTRNAERGISAELGTRNADVARNADIARNAEVARHPDVTRDADVTRNAGWMARSWIVALVTAAFVACAGCEDRVDRTARQLTGGDPGRAPAAIRRYGCGSCHTIPGIAGAHAVVAPPLNRFALRSYIAGRVTNDAASLERWIRHPHSIDPKTAMPEMGVGTQDARDIAAYLYTLR